MQPLTNEENVSAYSFYLSTLEHTDFPEIMNSHSNDIYDIYSRLKNNRISENNNSLGNIIKEIKKNKYSDVEYFILAQFLYRLKNIKDLSKEELYYPKTKWYCKNNFTTNISKLQINEKVKSIIKLIVDKFNANKLNKEDVKVKDIILRFTDEFNEVSKENSELSEKILRFLYHNQVLVVIKYLINSFKEKNIDNTIDILIKKKIFKNLLEGRNIINLRSFLKSLFEYSISVIDKDKIKDILTYILYFLVNNDMGIPIEIHELFNNGFFDASNDRRLGEILNLLGELRENLTLRRLFYLLSKQKRKLLQQEKPIINPFNHLQKPNSPPTEMSKSNNKVNFMVKSIESLIQGLNKHNIDNIVINLINSLKDNVNNRIKEEFPNLLNYQLSVFLSRLFNYIIEYISDKFIQNILTYIVYYFVNPNMRLPTNIENYYVHTPFNRFKDEKLLELFKLSFETQPPEILIKLFNLLSTRIYEIKRKKK